MRKVAKRNCYFGFWATSTARQARQARQFRNYVEMMPTQDDAQKQRSNAQNTGQLTATKKTPVISKKIQLIKYRYCWQF